MDKETAELNKLEVMNKDIKAIVLAQLKSLNLSGMITKREYDIKVELIDRKLKDKLS